MAEFGEDFDLDAFATAYDSDDPVLLNQIHDAARIVADEFTPFHDAYGGWIGQGFSLGHEAGRDP